MLFKRKSNKEIDSVVFIKLIEQGASVLAYAALKRAVKQYGKENVYFLVFEENRPILDRLEVLDPANILVIRNTSFWSFGKDLISKLILLNKFKVKAAIDMEFFSRAAAIIAYLSGASRRVGLYSFTSEHPYRGNLISHKIHYNPYLHVAQYYWMQLDALEEVADKEPRLKIPIHINQLERPDLVESMEDRKLLLEKLNLDEDQKIIVLNPNASDMLPLRKWDASKFSSLMKELRIIYPSYAIVFTGLPEEERRIRTIIQSNEDDNLLINFAGKTSLHELLVLFDLAELIVTNDSGPAHFGSMYKTKVLVLFGPETPKLFSPLGDGIRVIHKQLACSPCVNVFNHRFSPCTNNVCMQQIKVQEVVDEIKILLNE